MPVITERHNDRTKVRYESLDGDYAITFSSKGSPYPQQPITVNSNLGNIQLTASPNMIRNLAFELLTLADDVDATTKDN